MLLTIPVRGIDFRLSVVRISLECLWCNRYLEISICNRFALAATVLRNIMTVSEPLQTTFRQIAYKYFCINKRPIGFLHFDDLDLTSNYLRKFKFILKIDPKMTISLSYSQYIQMIEPSIEHFLYYWTLNDYDRYVTMIDTWSKSMYPDRWLIEAQKSLI